jgi:oxygen-independent coproporphyrinogen III oxidase
MAGLYFHIPFCKQACHYCDFHFSTNQTLKQELVNQLAEELSLQKDYLEGEPIETIYLGGGTPSLLTAQELELLFTVIQKNYQVATDIEVTLEANPDDLNSQKLNELKAAGVNRLSIGIQSFDENVLTFLNRAHTATEALSCVDAAHKSGINNISIDLIYSIPGQDDNMLQKNLATALALHPNHISAYSLTVEEKTVFGRWASKGKLLAMEEDQSAQQFELVMDLLTQNGYQHYEISNYCLPGFQSKHNTSYWKGKKYLGLGPSAHSYNGGTRQFNINNNHLYIKSIQKGIVPFEREELTNENKINEYLFTSLRTEWGCNLNYLLEQFGYDLATHNKPYLNQLVANSLINLSDNTITLTRAGKLLADRIASDLFVALDNN